MTLVWCCIKKERIYVKNVEFVSDKDISDVMVDNELNHVHIERLAENVVMYFKRK